MQLVKWGQKQIKGSKQGETMAEGREQKRKLPSKEQGETTSQLGATLHNSLTVLIAVLIWPPANIHTICNYWAEAQTEWKRERKTLRFWGQIDGNR